jgi:hypothetical protein
MPRKPKDTPHLRVRIEPKLLARLEKAREKSGRTLTGEIVHRIEQTFRKEEDEDLGRAFLGGDDTAKALQLIANAMRLETAAQDGTPWSGDQEKAEAVRTAAQLIISGTAGLPVTRPTIDYSDSTTELRPSERGWELAKYLLGRSNLSRPTKKEQPK